MLIIDIIGAAIVIAMLLTVPGVLYLRRRNDPRNKVVAKHADLQLQGEVNEVDARFERTRICWQCHKLTDPTVDLFVAGSWVHRTCHANLIGEP